MSYIVAFHKISGPSGLRYDYKEPLYSQDLIVNSPFQLLHLLLQISDKNFVLDQENNCYLISLSIAITCLLNNASHIIGKSYMSIPGSLKVKLTQG